MIVIAIVRSYLHEHAIGEPSSIGPFPSTLFVKYDPAAAALATHAAYFDAGGHPGDQDSVFMCGLVSSAAKWIKFDAAWIAALQSEGLTERFHMTRFVNGSHGYGAWKGDDDKRATTAERLLKIIKRHVHKCLVNGVYTADFRRVELEYDFQAAHLTPYALCGVESMSGVERWRIRNRLDAKLMFVFERGDADQASLSKRLAVLEGPIAYDRPSVDPNLDGPFGFTPFQACDLIAWVHVRTTRAIIRKESPRLLEVMNAYFRQIPHRSSFHNLRSLRNYCEVPQHRISKRI